MDRPLVSFFLFAYNQERFIREAVESALAQTYSPLEIILSDDCSTDTTFSIIQEVARKYTGAHKIILNRNEMNMGLGGHINRVASLTHGSWVVVMAGDDISNPDRTSRLMEAACQNPDAYGILSGWDVIDDESKVLNTGQNLLAADAVVRIERCSVSACLKVLGAIAAWRREVYTLFEPLRADLFREDVVFSFRALLCGPIIVVPAALLKYRKPHRPSWIDGLSKCDDKVEYVRCEEARIARWDSMLCIAYSQMKRDFDFLSQHVKCAQRNICDEVLHDLLMAIWSEQTKSEWWQLSGWTRLGRFFHYCKRHGNYNNFGKWMFTRIFGFRFYIFRLQFYDFRIRALRYISNQISSRDSVGK